MQGPARAGAEPPRAMWAAGGVAARSRPTPRRHSSAKRMRPRFHCFQASAHRRRLIHWLSSRSTDEVSQRAEVAAPSKEIARQLSNDLARLMSRVRRGIPQHSRYGPPTVWSARRRLIDGPQRSPLGLLVAVPLKGEAAAQNASTGFPKLRRGIWCHLNKNALTSLAGGGGSNGDWGALDRLHKALFRSRWWPLNSRGMFKRNQQTVNAVTPMTCSRDKTLGRLIGDLLPDEHLAPTVASGLFFS